MLNKILLFVTFVTATLATSTEPARDLGYYTCKTYTIGARCNYSFECETNCCDTYDDPERGLYGYGTC